MKLTTVTTMLKSNAVKLLAGAALAGAVFTAAAPAAQAERFHVGVRIGGPVFYGPRYVAPAPPVVVYGGPGYYAPRYGFAPRYDWRYHHIDRFGHRW